MYKVTILTYLIITSTFLLITSATSKTNAEPFVSINSDSICTTENDFNALLMTNGFQPNSNVHWDLVNKNDNSKALSGYFKTNDTGGFSELTFIDDVQSGEYVVHFFDDADFNGELDIGKSESFVDFPVPCLSVQATSMDKLVENTN